MSFAVIATSKRLSDAGISHIITAGGNIILDTEDHTAEAYDKTGKTKRGTPTKVTKTKKNGKTVWVATVNQKKQIPEPEYYKILMRLKRAAGWKPKPTGKKFPQRSAAIKKAWKSPKKFIDTKEAAKKAAKKPAGKKTAKKAAPAKKPAKKVAPAKKGASKNKRMV